MKEFADLERTYDSFYSPAFAIDIDGGTRFSTAQGPVSSVRVQTAIEKTNRISFTVGGVFDPQEGDFTGLDDQGLSVGNALTVSLGYGRAIKPVMKGEITDVKPTFPEGEAPTVDVTGHDYRDAMDQTAGDKSWDESKITAATRAIAENYGFDSLEIESGGPGGGASELELKQLVKDATSDREFLQTLSEQFDYEMFLRAGVLWFRRPTKDESPSVSLTYGRGLRSFETTKSSSKSQVETVKHKGVNHYNGIEVSGSTDRSGGDGETLLRKAPMESDTEATRRSEAEATDIDREAESDATTLGMPDLQIGKWIELTGLGSIGDRTYDGIYYVMEANHNVQESGYTTSVKLAGPREET